MPKLSRKSAFSMQLLSKQHGFMMIAAISFDAVTNYKPPTGVKILHAKKSTST